MSLDAVTSLKPAFEETKSRRWKIEGFSLHEKGECTSPVLFEIAGCKFQLFLKVVTDDSATADVAKKVDLRVLCQDSPGLNVSFTVCILGKEGKKAHSFREEGRTLSCKNNKWSKKEDTGKVESFTLWGWASLSYQQFSNHAVNDTLILELSLTASSTDTAIAHKIQGFNTADEQCGKNDTSQLFADIKELLIAKKHTDVVLRAVDAEGHASETFCAHRLVLASRSPVFEALFFEGGAQFGKTLGDSNGVQMTGMSPEIVQAFLHAVYTGEILDEVWNDEDALCHLLRGFHEYQVKELTDRCEKRIVKQLTEQNVAERLMMSDLLDMPMLRSAALDFIVSSPSRLANVQSTEGFNRLIDQRPRLLAEILSKATPPAKRARTAEKV
eukprot:TRINITY_DN24143_c0_g1_i1.p1 TRINITY_DN24143_c0_g1~~TRINITY_DN24143_c0_g1_i1.p1  ORF type:complete len:385 (-),score=48.84 TRINITY_DN24143_c0_g1_i1:217-1371(-)